MPLIYDVNTHPDTVRYYWQIRQRAASIVTSIPRARYYGTNRSILKKGGFSRTESVFSSSFQSSLCIKRETRYVCKIRNCEWEILHMTLSWMETKRNWIFFFNRNRITSDYIFFFPFWFSVPPRWLLFTFEAVWRREDCLLLVSPPRNCSNMGACNPVLTPTCCKHHGAIVASGKTLMMFIQLSICPKKEVSELKKRSCFSLYWKALQSCSTHLTKLGNKMRLWYLIMISTFWTVPTLWTT